MFRGIPWGSIGFHPTVTCSIMFICFPYHSWTKTGAVSWNWSDSNTFMHTTCFTIRFAQVQIELDWTHNWASGGAYALAMLMLKVSEGTLHFPASSVLDYPIFWVHDSLHYLHCHEQNSAEWLQCSFGLRSLQLAAWGSQSVTEWQDVFSSYFVHRRVSLWAKHPLNQIAVESQCRPWGVLTTPGSIWDVTGWD